jgi:uncharacterized membrane protein YqjE
MSNRQGVLWSLRHLLGDLLDIGRTRLALLANEAEEERIRIIGILVSGFLALASLVIGVVSLVVFLVLAFWESRLLALGASSLFFLLVALGFAWKSRADMKRGPLLFSASLRELKQDIASLRADGAGRFGAEERDESTPA